MCGWLTVLTSGFYDWLKCPQSATAARRDALAARIRSCFTASDGTYGYRRIHADRPGRKFIGDITYVHTMAWVSLPCQGD
jgi:hypothetical protein